MEPAQSTSGGMYPRVTLYDHSYETFSVQYLYSMLRQEGFSPELFYDCSMRRDYLSQDFILTPFLSLSPEQVADAILRTKPDVVGFSMITSFYRQLGAIIRILRAWKPDLVIIAGGPHCTLVPGQVLKDGLVDFVFVGEADYSLPAFLRALRSQPASALRQATPHALQGVWNMRDGQIVDRGYGRFRENLDEVPFPEKDAYYRKNPALRSMYTATCSRGCVFNCTYCNSSTMRRMYKDAGHVYFRQRSVANVIAELRHAVRTYHPRYVMFLDNLFAPRKEWLREFSSAYRDAINLPFFCETNPNVHTVETIDLLADARCTLLQFGFQSANESVRREVLGRGETNERIRELVMHARRRGMLVCVDHIANLPGEEKSHIDEALGFYRDLRPYWINLGFLQYYPRAAIVHVAMARKALRQEDAARIDSGEAQSSFRLLSGSPLGRSHRTLPMRLYAAIRLPRRIGDLVQRALDVTLVGRILSPFASVFIYASRILNAFADRRDFLVRHHVRRNLRVVWIVAKEKVTLRGRQPAHH